jgi:hypothetical protein
MPVADDGAGAQHAGVYAAVLAAVESDARSHAERVAGWSVDPAEHPYEMQSVLDALRAGESVDVPAWAVPRRVRPERCTDRVEATWYRAVVHPDDRVTLEPDDGSRWLEVNGL